MTARSVRIAALSTVAAILLAACTPVVVTDTPRLPPPRSETKVTTVARPAVAVRSPREAASNFTGVMRLMKPAVTRDCLARRTRPINCDFQFVVDDRPNLPPNAFQTQDAQGRPIVGFTLALIAEARNADEMAFVVGHEASHHILNHLARKSSSATAGAVILGGLAAAAGADPTTVGTIQRVGASVGSRVYSRDWELQADYLGAIITQSAGFDPINGAEFFRRIPDPGDHILGSHPSTASRMAQVRRAIDDVRTGRAR